MSSRPSRWRHQFPATIVHEVVWIICDCCGGEWTIQQLENLTSSTSFFAALWMERNETSRKKRRKLRRKVNWVSNVDLTSQGRVSSCMPWRLLLPIIQGVHALPQSYFRKTCDSGWKKRFQVVMRSDKPRKSNDCAPCHTYLRLLIVNRWSSLRDIQ